MSKSPKSRAEELFSASKKEDIQNRKEQDKEQRKRSEHLAGLKALRLAKAASDKELAEVAAAQTAADKLAAKAKKSARLPQPHRQN